MDFVAVEEAQVVSQLLSPEASVAICLTCDFATECGATCGCGLLEVTTPTPLGVATPYPPMMTYARILVAVLPLLEPNREVLRVS